jgi:heat shock protein HtpX
MTWFRRIAFFMGLNIVVMLTISLVLNVLGVGPYLTANGLNIGALMAFCLVWGMGGAFISLMISKMMAKWMMGVKIIDPQTANPQQRALLETVYRLARAAGLNKMPEVGIYESPEVNAFATGPTKNNSLVAVSSGLLYNMEGRALDGVLGHEITHIANGDMVTMTLIQGVVNAFVMALARIVAFAIDNALRGDRDSRGGGLGRFGYMMVVWVLEMLFFIPGSMVIGYFSRQREFRADQGGARYAGRDSMISALKNLQRMAQVNAAPAGAQTSAAFSSMKIASDKRGGFISLMASHPPLEERIARLERGV